MNASKGKLIASSILIVIAVGLLFPIYNSPIWWVSLEAPNYPEEAFPNGVRILFHANGVFNGCEKQEKAEITEQEALDCVHEMDTINHYVGMYPIASGGPVELFFSIFWISLLGIMALAFICVRPLIRTGIMVVGFGALAVWMGMTFLGTDGLKLHNTRYLEGRITVLGEEVEAVEDNTVAPSDDQLASLKASLQGENTELPEGVDALAALKSSLAGEKVEVVEKEEATPEPALEPVVAETVEEKPEVELSPKEMSFLYLKDAFINYY